MRLGVTVATHEGRDAHAVRWSLSREAPDTQADLQTRPAVVTWPELLGSGRSDEDGHLGFERRSDLRRVCVLAEHRAKASIVDRRSVPGGTESTDAQGLLQARLPHGGGYVTLVRWVTGLAPESTVTARVAVLGPSGRDPARRLVARLGMYDGTARVFAEDVVKNASLAARDPWTTLRSRLPDAEAESGLLFLTVKAEDGALTAADRLYVDELTVRAEER